MCLFTVPIPTPELFLWCCCSSGKIDTSVWNSEASRECLQYISAEFLRIHLSCVHLNLIHCSGGNAFNLYRPLEKKNPPTVIARFFLSCNNKRYVIYSYLDSICTVSVLRLVCWQLTIQSDRFWPFENIEPNRLLVLRLWTFKCLFLTKCGAWKVELNVI